MTQLPTVVVGAGVSGLAAAFRLQQAGRPVIVLESDKRAGGNILTAAHDGFLYDLGPDSFLKTKPAGVALLKDLGLESEMITPKPGASRVLVAQDGALFPMPEGLSLGVPKKPGPLLSTPLLSSLGKARALLEPFIPGRTSGAEESIAAFTTRRLGEEMALKLAAPLLSGVFAGDADRISMQAAFPQLVALEKKHGSLFSGMNGGKSILQVLREKAQAPGSPFVSLKRGLGQMIEALLASLPPDTVRFDQRVLELQKTDSGVRVRTQDADYDAAHVIFAGPPWAAAKLLGTLSSELDQTLSSIRGFQTATAFFGLDESQVHADLSGSGFIVPPGEARILAGTFISSKWAGRASEGKALIRAFLGGARSDIRSLSDEDLTELAQVELRKLLGDLGRPLFTRIYRYERGTPQPEIGHLERLARVESELSALPWLSLVGSGYGGVGIPDCIRQADEAVEQLLA